MMRRQGHVLYFVGVALAGCSGAALSLDLYAYAVIGFVVAGVLTKLAVGAMWR